jgi:hypothetical protein
MMVPIVKKTSGRKAKEQQEQHQQTVRRRMNCHDRLGTHTRTFEVVTAHVQTAHARERGQFFGEDTAHAGAGQAELSQVGHALHLGRDRARHQVLGQQKVFQKRHFTNLRGQSTGDAVLFQNQDLQVGQQAQFGRQTTPKLVKANAEFLQRRGLADFRRDGAPQ